MSLNTKLYNKAMLEKDQLYGITLNPAFQGSGSFKFMEAYYDFFYRLNELKSLFPYIELYPEYSPVMETKFYNHNLQIPRLHFHGVVMVDPVRYYLTEDFVKLSDFCHMKLEYNYDYDYCTKNKAHMKRLILDDYEIPYKQTWETIDLDLCKKWHQRTVREDFDIDTKLLDQIN